MLLAVSGIDVNLQDQNGRTALMYASQLDHPEVVKMLLAAPGVDVNRQDNVSKPDFFLVSNACNDKTYLSY